MGLDKGVQNCEGFGVGFEFMFCNIAERYIIFSLWILARFYWKMIDILEVDNLQND